MQPTFRINSLNEPYQTAYRPCHSTETAVLKVANDILLELDNRRVVLLTLLDFSAAFDRVDQRFFWIDWVICMVYKAQFS